MLDGISKQRPVADLFGILRRRCKTCAGKFDAGLSDYDCPGYQPLGTICPSPSNDLDFPTFCQNCGCPACFHQIIKVKSSLPEPLSATIRSFNIRQTDINFNAAFIAFEIKPEDGDYDGEKWATRNVGALVTLLRGEGLEVLSLE